jgi:hypothetical protein
MAQVPQLNMGRSNGMLKPFGLIKQTFSGDIVRTDETTVIDKRDRDHEVTEDLASHVHKRQHALPLSLIINDSEIMTRMTEAFANHPFPAESVIRSRLMGGFNKSVPGASL